MDVWIKNKGKLFVWNVHLIYLCSYACIGGLLSVCLRSKSERGVQ